MQFEALTPCGQFCKRHMTITMDRLTELTNYSSRDLLYILLRNCRLSDSVCQVISFWLSITLPTKPPVGPSRDEEAGIKHVE